MLQAEDRAKTEGSKVLPLCARRLLKTSILPDSCWATLFVSDPKSTHNSFTKFCRKLKKDENKNPKGAQGFKQLVCNHTTTRAARGGAELATATATLEPRSRGRRWAAAIPPLLPAPRLQNLGAFSWDEQSGVCVSSWSGPHQTRGRQRRR